MIEQMKHVLSKKLIYSLILLAGICLIGSLLWWRWSLGTSRRMFTEVQKTISFPLLFPEKLPSGYKLELSQMNGSKGVVVYSIASNAQDLLVVTEQAYPKDFDDGSLKGNEEFTTDLGKAYIVTFEDRTTATLIAGQTWVLINYPGRIDTEDMKTILRGFVKTSR